MRRWAGGPGNGQTIALCGGALLVWAALAGCAPRAPQPEDALPISPSAIGILAPSGAVAAGNPLAAQVGLDVLRRGGNAVDAAVATAFALGVVELDMISLGGGGSMTIWVHDDARADYVDFYSSAGAERGGSGAAGNVAVPGKVAGLLEAHQRYGVLSREAVLEPAIRLARHGFIVNARLAESVEDNRGKIEDEDDVAAVFFPGGEPIQPGDRLVQEALAASLQQIARDGRAGFDTGPGGRALISRLAADDNPMTIQDLERFQPKWRRPLCGAFREFTVLTAPPPLGGSEVVQALALLDRQGLREHGTPYESAEAMNLVVDAIRIARADYRRWIVDPEHTAVPGAGLASRGYAAQRSALMGGAARESIEAGDADAFDGEPPPDRCARLDPYPPAAFPAGAWAAASGGGAAPVPESAEPDGPGAEYTTHLSVIDADRNAVAVTMTLGPAFGSGVYAGGAFYNNAITRFSSSPEGNQWAPYRTPRSATAPTVVLQGDNVRLVTGAQGGSRIPTAVTHTILYALEYDMSGPEAMAAARAFPFWNSPQVHVEGAFRLDPLAALRERGFDLTPRTVMDSYLAGAHLVRVREDGMLEAAADLRRAGGVAGY